MDFESFLNSSKMTDQEGTMDFDQAEVDIADAANLTTCSCKKTTVNFCCVKNIPDFITAGLTTNPIFPRITYDPNCLTCVVEPCQAAIPCNGGSQTVCLFAAKIVGCMPYQIETRYAAQSPSNICPDPFPADTFAIVCVDSARFNNPICLGTEAEMEDVCAEINRKLRSTNRCALIESINRTATLNFCPNYGGRYVLFLGQFRINFTCPSCL